MDVEKKLAEHESRLIAHDALIKANGEQNSQILQKQAQLETLLGALERQAERHKAEYNDKMSQLQSKVDADIQEVHKLIGKTSREVQDQLDKINRLFASSLANPDDARRKWERMLDRDEVIGKMFSEMRSFFWRAFLMAITTVIAANIGIDIYNNKVFHKQPIQQSP